MTLLPYVSDTTVRGCTIAASGFVTSRAMFRVYFGLVIGEDISQEACNYILARSYQMWAADNPVEAADARRRFASLARSESVPGIWKNQNVS